MQVTLRFFSPDLNSLDFAERLLYAHDNLTHLHLQGGRSSATDPAIEIPAVVDFLRRATSLQSLQADGYKLDVLPLLQVLQQQPNHQLTKLSVKHRSQQPEVEPRAKEVMSVLLDLVQHQNLTLTSLVPWQHWDSKSKIAYYLTLNSFGRAKVRSSSCASVLIDLLREVQGKHPNGNSLGIRWVELNVTFGLLRENPSLWCSASSNMDGNSGMIL